MSTNQSTQSTNQSTQSTNQSTQSNAPITQVYYRERENYFDDDGCPNDYDEDDSLAAMDKATDDYEDSRDGTDD
jgi:hypothetical protein